MKVFIMCGIPGSGKSTKARELGRIVHSADDYFTNNLGEYEFNPNLLPKAHAKCLRNFLYSCAQGQEVVIVDNTNSSLVELAPYVAIGQAYGYEVVVKVMKVWNWEACWERNIHGVPKETVKAMHDRIKALRFPPWWTVEEVEVD